MAGFLMILSLELAHMMMAFNILKKQVYKFINKDVIDLLSILDFLSMLHSYPFIVSRLEAHCYFVIQYFDTRISPLNSPGFLANHIQL